MQPDVEISRANVGPLPWLSLRGPRRGVFLRLGQLFGDVISKFLEGPSERERVARARSSPHLQPIVEATRRHFPVPVSELEATAEGAEVPFEELLLLNIRGDLGFDSDGCSDLAICDPRRLLLVHNEDAAPIHEGDCPLLTLHIDGDLPLTTFWYPGMLVAMTFWLNAAGIACGVDHVAVANPGPGVGRQFLARRLAGATSVREFVSRAEQAPVAGGYAYMVGSRDERRLVNVEVGPSGVSAHDVAGRYTHTNHFLSLSDGQVIDEQSVPRLEILDSVEEPVTRKNALATFTDPLRGIWRDATRGDPLLTLCSVVFDFEAREVLLHPRGDSESHTLGFEEFVGPTGPHRPA